MKGGALLIDLTGKTFSRLTVLYRYGSTNRGEAKWLCQCNCGVHRAVTGNNLRSGKTQSCGCLHKEQTAVLSRDRWAKRKAA